jgi:hypothetical protein
MPAASLFQFLLSEILARAAGPVHERRGIDVDPPRRGPAKGRAFTKTKGVREGRPGDKSIY